MNIGGKFMALGAALAGLGGSAAGQAVDSGQTIAVGATVLPMTRDARLSDQTVIVRGDRIVSIGPRRRVSVPSGARVVDARGKVLMPGLVDMHVHLAPTPGSPGDPAQRALAVMLANGITTIRGMAGSPANLDVRKKIEAGTLPGPRFYAAAPALNDRNTTSVEQGRAAVDAAKTSGFDLIKSHELSNVAVWQAIEDEAHKLGLPTAGHVNNAIGLDRAIAAGEEVEHLDGAIAELVKMVDPAADLGFGQVPPPPVVAVASRVSDAQLRQLAQKLAAAKSWQVPTLGLFEKISDVDTPVEQRLADPDMRYVPDPVLKQWAEQSSQLRDAGYTTADGAAFRALRSRIVRAYHDAGVQLMSGSDTAQSFHLWGPALLAEVRTLAAAGLAPLEALRAATVTPRDYFRSLPNGGSALGWKADFGTVEPGARADLILLAADPSVSLDALQRPDLVIAGGRAYDRAMLDAMLDRAAHDAKAAPPAAAEQLASAAKQAYIMRHLPAATGDDPPLSAAGAAQAREIAAFLRGADIKAVFATAARRAQQTAAAFGLPMTTYDPRNPDELVKAAAAVPGNVLVIGHSNTVPDLVTRFGGVAPAPLGERDFGTIYRVDSGARLTREFSLGGTPPAALGPCTGKGLNAAMRCGSIRVPENRAARSGRMLDIHFAVLPASGLASDDPLVMLPGGPGLGGVQSGAGIEQLFGEMLKDRDLILIDQRGTGESNALNCPQEPDDADPIGQLGDSTPADVIECRDALANKADLRFYHTREAVRDMDLVRAALGYRRLDLFGMSYGTRVALDYLRLYADRVGQTVIRAAAPPEMKLPLYSPRDTQRSFDRMAEACRAQADCARRYPDLPGDLDAILARLEQGAVPISIRDPHSGKPIAGKLNRNGFGSVMFAMLYIPEFYSQLPPLLDQAKAENFSPIVQAAAPFLLGVGDEVSWGMRWSVICDEDVRRIAPRDEEYLHGPRAGRQ